MISSLSAMSKSEETYPVDVKPVPLPLRSRVVMPTRFATDESASL